MYYSQNQRSKKWILFFKIVFSYLVTVEDTGENDDLDLSISQNLTNDLFKKNHLTKVSSMTLLTMEISFELNLPIHLIIIDLSIVLIWSMTILPSF